MPLRRGDDQGESLVELLFTITILGVVAIAIGAGFTLSLLASTQHKLDATADYFLHNYAETLQTTTYTACSAGTPPDYVTIAGLAAPAGFSVPKQTAIKFWNGSAFVAGCPGTDLGLQEITLTLSSSSGRASEAIVVVVRKQ